MGFLDEVKRQRAEQQSASEAALPAAEIPAHLQAVQPRLLALYEFLNRFAQELSATPPELHVGYQVSNFGKIQMLNQGEYAAIADDTTRPTQVAFQFTCRGPRTMLVEADSREKNQWQQDYLLEHGLRFHCKSRADWRYTLTVEEFVPVSFTFLADEKEALIRLEIFNGDSLGIERHTFEPEQISAEFMEELAKRVLHRPSRFDELCGNRVSNDARRQFRAKLAARRFEREAELGDTSPVQSPAKSGRFGRGVFRWRKTSEHPTGHASK